VIASRLMFKLSYWERLSRMAMWGWRWRSKPRFHVMKPKGMDRMTISLRGFTMSFLASAFLLRL